MSSIDQWKPGSEIEKLSDLLDKLGRRVAPPAVCDKHHREWLPAAVHALCGLQIWAHNIEDVFDEVEARIERHGDIVATICKCVEPRRGWHATTEMGARR